MPWRRAGSSWTADANVNRLRLQYQIALATFLPLIVFALLGGAVSAYALRTIPQSLVLQRQLALTQVAAAGVAGTLKGYVRLLESTAVELGEMNGDPGQLQGVLQARAAVLSPFTAGVGVLDTAGTAIAATRLAEPSLGLNFAFRPYFQEAQRAQGPVFSTVFQDQPAGFDAVIIAVPVRRQGAFAGLLVGELALSRREWARDLNLLRTDEGGQAYLIDNASVIIYHPDPDRIGQSVQSDPDVWRLVIGGEARSVLQRPAGAQERMVVAYAPLPGIAWGLITEEPWEAIVAPIMPYQWAAAGLLTLGVALALVALVLSVRRVTRPVNALIAAGQEVAGGRPFRPLAVEGPPDMRTLLAVINQMVARLGEQRAALRSYAQRVLAGQEEERLRLSRDLHDETVQDLIALTQRLELCSDLWEENPAAARGELQQVRELARGAAAEVRRMSNNMRPSILADLGLAAGLQALARDLGRSLPGARVSCEVVGEEQRLSPELELTAFRIAQEALTNVRKHAATASRVNIALFYEAWGIQLMIEDDGSGFEPAAAQALVHAGHMGLTGMAERAQLFGGRLQVNSTPGEGATVSLRLPRQLDAG